MTPTLPLGWSLEPLGSLACEVRASATPTPGVAYELWSVPSFADGRPERLLGEQIGSVKRSVAPGDLLLCKINPRINRVWVVGPMPVDATQVASPEWIVLRMARPDVDGRFLLYFLRSPEFRRRIEGAVHGVTGSHTRARVPEVMSSMVPVPPLDEQRRIVDILEDHLSRLDAATDYLDAAQRRLERIEQVTLERLTAIGVEHHLGEISAIQSGIQKQAKRRPVQNTFPFLRVANVTSTGLDLSEVHLVELFAGELARYRLLDGDLLVVEGNGSPSQIGRAATWDGSIKDCVHQNHLIRVRPAAGLLPEYLEAAWNAAGNRRALTALASSTSGLYTLSVSKLQTLTIRVPSPEVQARVAVEVRSIRDARSALDKAVANARQRAWALRRSLLAAAFSGRLTGRTSDMDLAEELAS